MNELHRGPNRFWLLALLAFVLPWSAQAQVTRDWVGVTPGVYGDMVAVDKDNNVIAVGSVPWSTMLISKYGRDGVQSWQRIFDNPGTREQSSFVTVDAQGNVIVTGYLVSGSNDDRVGLVVLKFDPAGNLLWQDIIPAAFGYAWRATADQAGNVYVLGRIWVANASGNTTHDIVTLKYSPGGVRQWHRFLGLDNYSVDTPAAMALTPAGNVIVVGGTAGYMLMAAYDPAGNAVWTKTVAAATGATHVAVGPGGEFVVVGGSYSRKAGNQFLVIKHDAAFNESWRNSYGVGHYALRAAIDSKGNAVVTGVTGSYLDWMTIKLDPGGNLLWSRRYDQHAFNDEIPYWMVLGPDDAAYITGQGGPGPTSGNISDLSTVTVKYASNGSQLWVATNPESVRGMGVALGGDNSVAVVGESPLTVLHYVQTGAVNLLPVAVAAATGATSGPAPLTVGFSSAGSTDPDGQIVAMRWDFGDGATSSLANPSHVYAVGTYRATLTVTDNLGSSATSAPITIAADPTAPPPPTTTPTSLLLSSTTVTGGRSATATVTVSSTAGVVLNLSSSDGQLASVPSTIEIPAGSKSAKFRVRTSKVRSTVAVTISASANGGSVSAVLTLVPR